MSFIDEVINWYKQNKRDLPWRNTQDPYIIWLSEIILQQTRVDQGLPYFHRFAERYPTVSAFAAAEEDEILKLWQGLGYYSRGRNMRHTAQMVMEEHGGYFPQKYDELIKLKGIGEYTAAAISSFSSNEAKAVVDGNVFRLLSRYFGIDEPVNSSKAKKIFTDLANSLIDKGNAGLSNQAIMEFGSLQCRPKRPDCGLCPLRISCEAYLKDQVDKLPVKLKKQQIKNRYFYYVIAVKEDKVLFNKRGPNDIWQNLYEFPLIELEDSFAAGLLSETAEFQKLFGTDVVFKSEYGPVKHILSHQKIEARFALIDNFTADFMTHRNWFFTNINQLEQYAVPKLIFAFLKIFPNLKF